MVTVVVAGGNSSAFLTRAHDEFPPPAHPQLLQRCNKTPTSYCLQCCFMREHIIVSKCAQASLVILLQ